MKVTHTPLIPTEAAKAAGRPCFTPELLAASGARYSRNNSGIEEIYSKIDFNNLDKSVDGIFKMVDYGHQSIADMTPVAMFMDEMSLYLAYHLWSMCAVVGGQESSTRYIKISVDGVVDPDILGIPKEHQADWRQFIANSFVAYNDAVNFWENLSRENPSMMRIPGSFTNDTTDKGVKVLERMRRNYVFDRARYFLPLGAATNVMMVMPAREWVKLINDLLSSSIREFNMLGEALRVELDLCAPRLLRHAIATDSTIAVVQDEFEWARKNADFVWSRYEEPGKPYLKVFPPNDCGDFIGCDDKDYPIALQHRTNRYSRFGSSIRRTGVRFGWNAVAMAEIRDLNRHRTGEKFCPLIPLGFYAALDQLPEGIGDNTISDLATWGANRTTEARNMLANDSNHSYMYYTLLGSEFPFEHLTTANHFLYEAELRTGVGAHYRYAKHLKDVLQLWYQLYPDTKRYIFEGSAEPE